MDSSGDILIFVEPRHATSMMSGLKSVELRRRSINITPGTRVWIYSKLPQGQIQVLATVDKVVEDKPINIWKTYGARSAISKNEFDDYFAGTESSCAILFREIIPLAPVLDLIAIRKKFSNFHPPQFFKRLSSGSPVLAYFQTALAVN